MLGSSIRSIGARNSFRRSVCFPVACRHISMLPNSKHDRQIHASLPNTFAQARKTPHFEATLPKLNKNEFVVSAPEVSGPSGMVVSGELGEICQLAVKEGDFVKEDAVVAVIETVKASIEARCRASGIVKRVLTNVGDMVFESQPLYIMEAR